MIKVLIADDEYLAREDIKYFLSKYDEFSVVGEANHGKEVLEMNRKFRPDVIFLDIKMPVLSGIEVAKIINDLIERPEIVFLTAYDDYAINAFELDAIDYMLKPISEDRFNRCIEKLKAKLSSNEGKYKSNNTSGNYRNMQIISAYKNGVIIPIRYNDIIYATICDRDTILVTKNDEYRVNITLCELYESLKDYNFYKTHKSFIINLNYIDRIEPWFNSTYNIIVRGIDIKIPVSRNYVKGFRERMNIN
ncbi:response regulator transcription factor [Soehngenia saccharolytica]|nr:response regulator transcription factor [Soehngenia saccharolytica]